MGGRYLLIYAAAMMLAQERGVLGLYGFDCGAQVTNVTTISLIDIGECDIEQPKVKVEPIYGHLVQLNEFALTHVFKCGIKLTRQVTHCGMHSHMGRVTSGELSYFLEISREECEKIHVSGTYTIGKGIISGIPRNSTTHRSVVLAGSVSADSTCQGETFSDPYGSWDSVLVAGWVEISLWDYITEVHLETNKVKLRSGINCKLAELTCIDQDAAHVFWNALPVDTCGTSQYSALYEGKIKKATDPKTGKILYNVEAQDLIFSLWKRGETQLCGVTLIRTEHPKLFIVENEERMQFHIPAAANLDIFAYVNTKFLYMEKHIRKQMSEMYYDLIKKECELERKIIQNAIGIAKMDPAEAGYKIVKEQGYLGIIAGEVLHLIKCIKVEIKQRPTEECYEELPIYWNKESFFLTPRTHTIVRTGTRVACDPRIPPMYKINDVWIKLLPKGVTARDPEVLRPQTKPTWNYHTAESLAIGGIYGEKDLSRLRDMLMFPIEKTAVLNNVALGITGRKAHTAGMSISPFLDASALEEIASNTWKKVWARFLTFGSASAGVLGILLIFRIIKLVLDTIVHGYALYSLYGFSVHLLGAIWNSVTQLLIHLSYKNLNKEKEKREKESEKLQKKEKEEVIEMNRDRNYLYPHIIIRENARDSV